MAVTEEGEVFIWGWDAAGQCGNWSYGSYHVLPRRVEALVGIKARSASADGLHSLVVTETGARCTHLGDVMKGSSATAVSITSFLRSWWIRCAMCASPPQLSVAATH